MDFSILEAIREGNILEAKTVKQEQILAASIQLFAEKGFANTSTAEIAKEAGVSVGTLFNNYKTKETLLLAIVIPAIGSLIPKVSEEDNQRLFQKPDLTFEDFLYDIIEGRLNFVSKNKELFQVILKEALYKEELTREIRQYFALYAVPFLTKTIETFKEKGQLKSLPTELLIKFTISHICGLVISQLLLGGNMSLKEADIREAIALVMTGIKA